MPYHVTAASTLISHVCVCVCVCVRTYLPSGAKVSSAAAVTPTASTPGSGEPSPLLRVGLPPRGDLPGGEGGGGLGRVAGSTGTAPWGLTSHALVTGPYGLACVGTYGHTVQA